MFAHWKGLGEVHSEGQAWIKAKKHEITRSSASMECKIPVELEKIGLGSS